MYAQRAPNGLAANPRTNRTARRLRRHRHRLPVPPAIARWRCSIRPRVRPPPTNRRSLRLNQRNNPRSQRLRVPNRRLQNSQPGQDTDLKESDAETANDGKRKTRSKPKVPNERRCGFMSARSTYFEGERVLDFLNKNIPFFRAYRNVGQGQAAGQVASAADRAVLTRTIQMPPRVVAEGL